MSASNLPVEPSRPAAEDPSRAQAPPGPANHGTPPDAPAQDDTSAADVPVELPRLQQPRKGRRLARPTPSAAPLTAQQRLLLLDSWRRSGLPAADFAALVA